MLLAFSSNFSAKVKWKFAAPFSVKLLKRKFLIVKFQGLYMSKHGLYLFFNNLQRIGWRMRKKYIFDIPKYLIDTS